MYSDATGSREMTDEEVREFIVNRHKSNSFEPRSRLWVNVYCHAVENNVPGNANAAAWAEERANMATAAFDRQFLSATTRNQENKA